MKYLISEHAAKFEGMNNVQRIRDQIKADLIKVLEEENKEVVYPILFENEMGKWQIHEDGQVFMQPIMTARQITLDITLPDFTDPE
jgi:hypothetical protein